MKSVLIAVVKLAMNAQMSDAEIAKDLREAADAVMSGNYWSWSQKNNAWRSNNG